MWNRKPLKEVAYTAGRIGWKGLTAREYVAEGPNFLSVHSLNYGDFVDFRDAFNITQARYDESPEIAVEANDILICKDGAGIGKVGIVKYVDAPTTINSSLLLIRSLSEIYPKFLYHYLQSPFFQKIVQERIEGATTPHLYQREIKEFPVPIPELSEQQRIVAILDQAFADIEKARVNAEKNLKNARELFDSYLQQVFSQRGEGWVNVPFSQCFKLTSGDNLTSKNMIAGDFPVYGGNEIAGMHNEFNLHGDNVIIGRVGALCGNARHIQKKIWLTDNAFKIVDFKYDFDNAFLTYMLNFKKLRNLARQAAQPVISNSSLKDLALDFPISIEEQRAISSRADWLFQETSKLTSVYINKQKSLDELKKSLLQKAFSGELTKTEGMVA